MISIKNVTYKIKNKTILSQITINIKENEKVLISGDSGCGKSTIFNLILGNVYPTSGNIYFNKKDINLFSNKERLYYRQNEIAIIYQKDDLYENLSVNENLTMFYYQKDVDYYLKKTKLSYLKNKKVYEISGGERQRIAIIKTLLSNCKVLLCDEITSALDEKNALEILDFIDKTCKDKTIIYICHNPLLLKNKINRHIIIKDHMVYKDFVISQVEKINSKHKIKPRKTLLSVALTSGLKKISPSSFLIYIFLLISLYVTLNFDNIAFYFAKQSYEKYFNYDVVEIIDNTDITPDNVNSYYSLENLFTNSTLTINKQYYYNIRYLPFNNSSNNSKIVINSLFMQQQNIEKISTISIKGLINYESNIVDICFENNMFSSPCIYYDIKYFSSLNSNNTNVILINHDFTKNDSRFTNNPLYENKKEDKPYIDSNAYKDYLTFLLVFDSIELIINYFLYIILTFCIISCILINFSSIMKDIKSIAIFLSKGYSDKELLLSYTLPLVIYTLLALLLNIYINVFLMILISTITYFISILISYYYIKRKNLHTLLKEETLC